jgi:hypothetical protein
MFATPLLPSTSDAKVSVAVEPQGVTIPMPVMTTRFKQIPAQTDHFL